MNSFRVDASRLRTFAFFVLAVSTGTSVCLAQTVTVDFEIPGTPCVFAQTGPLRDQLSAQGVHFFGPNFTDGGAVLD